MFAEINDGWPYPHKLARACCLAAIPETKKAAVTLGGATLKAREYARTLRPVQLVYATLLLIDQEFGKLVRAGVLKTERKPQSLAIFLSRK